MSPVSTISLGRKALWLLLFFTGFQTAHAGISLFLNNRSLDPETVFLRSYFDTSSQHDFRRFLEIEQHLQPLSSGNLNMSYKDGMFWFTINLAALPGAFDYVLLNNPHINFLGAWLTDHDSLVHRFPLTGDHLPFYSRDVGHPQFVYSIPPAFRKATLVLVVDKRNEQLHLPVYFFTANAFVRHNRITNILVGLLVGIGLFILLFTLFLYLNIRERLYVYYTLYVLMVAGYIFTDAGFSFMFFYPDVPSFADFARPISISLAPLFYILFARNLLQVQQHFPRLFRFTNWFIAGFILLFVLGFLVIPNTGPIRTFWLILMQVVMIAAIIPVFVFAVASYRARVHYGGYILLASGLFTVFTQVYMQFITGNLPNNIITRNAVNFGFIIEISLLALALSIRFKNYKLEAENLLRQLNRQQENIFKNISEYQEKEMKRISGLLHDSVGAGLSSIKYNLEAVETAPVTNADLLSKTIADVSVLTDEIRTISHNLSPLLLQKKGLEKGLQDLVAQYNRTGKVQVLLEFIGSLRATAFQNELLVYRIIQELLHNAIKHSCATEIMIQLMLEPELISVFVEDNGRGFDKSTTREGLGFSQISGLITFVNGRFEVDSQINKGCRISIEFPVIPHEWTDKSTAGRRSSYVFGRG